jgi:hypothetical protein
MGILIYESGGKGPLSYFLIPRSPSQYPMSTYSTIDKRPALATHLMEGSGAPVGVNYPGYRGLLVMAQNSRTRPVSYSGMRLGNHTPRTWG